MPGFLPRVAFCLIVSLVGGCSTESEAIFRSFNSAVFQDSAVDSAPLNPNYRYLRVTASGGRIALLALGYIDKSPDGPIEVWYSGEREALRLRNGRVVSAAGMPTEWRNVILPPLPDWPVLVGGNEPVVWSRLRDVMPGYRMSVRDTVTLQPSRPPRDTELKGVDPSDLAWFEERTGARAQKIAHGRTRGEEQHGRAERRTADRINRSPIEPEQKTARDGQDRPSWQRYRDREGIERDEGQGGAHRTRRHPNGQGLAVGGKSVEAEMAFEAKRMECRQSPEKRRERKPAAQGVAPNLGG